MVFLFRKMQIIWKGLTGFLGDYAGTQVGCNRDGPYIDHGMPS